MGISKAQKEYDIKMGYRDPDPIPEKPAQTETRDSGGKRGDILNTNALTLLLVGVYLIAVVIQGNTKKFITEIGHEKGFLKFGGSLVVLVITRDLLSLGKVGDYFIYAAILGMFLNIVGSDDGERFLQQIEDL